MAQLRNLSIPRWRQRVLPSLLDPSIWLVLTVDWNTTLISPPVDDMPVCLARWGEMQLGGNCVELSRIFSDGQPHGDWVGRASYLGRRTVVVSRYRVVKRIGRFCVESPLRFFPIGPQTDYEIRKQMCISQLESTVHISYIAPG